MTFSSATSLLIKVASTSSGLSYPGSLANICAACFRHRLQAPPAVWPARAGDLSLRFIRRAAPSRRGREGGPHLEHIVYAVQWQGIKVGKHPQDERLVLGHILQGELDQGVRCMA